MNNTQPTLDDIEPLPPTSLAYGNLFQSQLAIQHDSPQHPLIVYGHDALDTAAFIAHASTLCALSVNSLDNLQKALENHACIGIYAMSRTDRSGEAAEALAVYDAHTQGPGMKLYGAWSTDVDEAAELAEKAGAHGVIMPDVDAQEWFTYMFAILQAIGEEKPLPRTATDIRQHLKVAFPNSPFWQNQQERVPEPDVW